MRELNDPATTFLRVAESPALLYSVRVVAGEVDMKRALVTGITGQDGSYLAGLLLDKGYEVWGMIRRSSSFHTGRIDHLYRDRHEPDVRLRLVYGDMSDGGSLASILKEARPDEVYNLAAQSHVRVSFDQPLYTADVDALGTLRLLGRSLVVSDPEAAKQACELEGFYRPAPRRWRSWSSRPRTAAY